LISSRKSLSNCAGAIAASVPDATLLPPRVTSFVDFAMLLNLLERTF
jgi:hypothetical protein